MTSPPAKHNPPDDRPGREDAGQTPSLRGVEAQRHSESFEDMARRIARSLPPSDFGSHRAIMAFAAALKSVDLAAREECARIAQRVHNERFGSALHAVSAILNTIRD